jgi:hypothetical protein
MTTVAVLGVDAGSGSVREADHLLAELADGLGLPEGFVGCTHLIRTSLPHVAVSLAVPAPPSTSGFFQVVREIVGDVGLALGSHPAGPARLAEGAALAVSEHVRSGRAVRFPGIERLTGRLTVRDILEGTAIDRVLVLMAKEPPLEALVDTRDHVRPEWRDGRLTLLTMPAGPGLFAPYEVPNPTPCCADHA